MKKAIEVTFLVLLVVALTPTTTKAQSLPACGVGEANGLADGDIDHYDLVCFNSIPDSYVTAARNMNLLWIDRSVGANILDGLNCLGSGTPYASAPNSCKSSLNESTYVSDTKYDRSNWVFAHYGDGGWYDSVSNFILNTGLRTPVNNVLTPFTPNYDEFEVFNFQFSYLTVAQGSDVVGNNGYFRPFPGDTNRIRDVHDMNAFEDSRPSQTFVHATTSLARSIGGQTSFDFNNLMRQHAENSGEFVIDFADIGSHNPNGVPCFDSLNYPVLCADYTTETNGGHLSYGLGKQRVAQAMWLMMTGVAGWTPGSTGNTPTPRPSNSPTLSPSPSATLTPTPIPLPGDINGDNVVNIQDYILLSNAFGTTNTSADLNGDGTVNIQDYIILSNNFGRTI